MNGRDFLPLATRLAEGTTEADWRSAVSRAYYAAFHVARRLFFDLKFTVPRADRAHQYLVFRLAALEVSCGPWNAETMKTVFAEAFYFLTLLNPSDPAHAKAGAFTSCHGIQFAPLRWSGGKRTQGLV